MGVNIVTAMFSIDSHKRRALLSDAGGGASGRATARALRSKIKLSRHVIPRSRPPKQRNSARISLQPTKHFWREN